ncbi:MAG: PH domain-containing protein [Microbacterium sp.]
MTQTPITPEPDSNPSEPRPVANPIPPWQAVPSAPPVLDEGTYTQGREPRSESRLVLDGQWHRISPKYVVSQVVQAIIGIVVVIIAGIIVYAITQRWWVLLIALALVLIDAVSLIILPRQAKALGYMLRADDIVFRRGILWQRMVAVPYGRMQLVDITQGPLDRAFGISKLKMVTAAATTGVEIPGVAQAAAESLRDTLIAVAEDRRTGL